MVEVAEPHPESSTRADRGEKMHLNCYINIQLLKLVFDPYIFPLQNGNGTVTMSDLYGYQFR